MTVKPAIKSTDADVIKIITSKPRDEIPIVKKSQVEDFFNKQEEEKLLHIVLKTENKTFLNVFEDESIITEDLTYCSLTKDNIMTLGPEAAIQIFVIPERGQVEESNKQEETSLVPLRYGMVGILFYFSKVQKLLTTSSSTLQKWLRSTKLRITTVLLLLRHQRKLQRGFWIMDRLRTGILRMMTSNRSSP